MNYEKYEGRGRHRVSGETRPITYLPNESEWVERILCVEGADQLYTGDEILGGTHGIANAPIQALANRTYALREQLSKTIDVVNALIAALAPQMTALKTLTVQTTAPADTTHTAWLNIGSNIENPSVVLTLENGSVIKNPTFKLTLENGDVVYISTDGSNLNFGSIGFFEDEE